MRFRFSLLIVALFFFNAAPAIEGMWLPMLLNKNIAEMQQMGFKLNADDVYSANHSSLKDAIVLFGGGCTGELISPDGLLVTNHHCGFRQIQSHSTVENDILTNGFWAMNKNEELANPTLSVSFLVKMEDVTKQIIQATDSIHFSKARIKRIAQISDSLKRAACDSTNYKATIKSFFNGNQFFLIVTETFKDVRLVGAPPSAIGKFGGDTDNWMWPRHTGDFSLFRIYADKDNKPAEYSPDNVPYHPKKFLPINISGVEENDFTMIFGFPGRTDLNLYSKAVELIQHESDKNKIAVRDMKLSIMEKYMESDSEFRIKYAAKYSYASNAWKKWQGERKGLQRINAVELKKQQEADFENWVNENPERIAEYGKLFPRFDSLYHQLKIYQKPYDLYSEIIYRGTDAYQFYLQLKKLASTQSLSLKGSNLLEKQLKDYSPIIDEAVFVQLMQFYSENLESKFLPKMLIKYRTSEKAEKKLEKLYQKSVLSDTSFILSIINEGISKHIINIIERDRLVLLFDDINNNYRQNTYVNYQNTNASLNKVYKTYTKAVLEKNNDKLNYPDANQTLRVSYGKIEGYAPRDAVYYDYFTTLDGMMEKDNPEIYDYKVPDKLKALYAEKNFGEYAMRNGQLPVCFAASNHTTGGNSGSPILNSEGHLIGINFDRCWEGTMSDLIFDPDKCRNIALDARYMLFLIDKFAGAGYLLDEMKIINTKRSVDF